jgi:hypothetical protein
MSETLLKDSLNTKIAYNVLLKSRILSAIFGFIFIVQIVVLFVLQTKPAFQSLLSNKLIYIGPFLILGMVIGQAYFIKLSKDWLKTGIVTEKIKLYLLVAIEVSFPGFVLLFLCSLLNDSSIISPEEMLNSPVLIIIFIFIIISALYLDFKISLISSIIPAIQYILVSINFLPPFTPVFFSGIAKGVLMVLCGILSGIISKKIQEGIHESVESKNLLINELDRLVHEKTVELKEQNAQITFQKKEIEEKQKEIVDSIKYASRIQNALMTPESHFEKGLNKLQGELKKKN